MELPVDKILCGDAAELMRGRLPEESVHAIVTDPPYGLEFMGEEWDTFKKVESPYNPKPKLRINTIETKNYTCPSSHFPKKNPRCRKCGRLMFDHEKSKCHCEQPDFDHRTAEYPREYQKWTTAWAREALRVLKPGASMLVMGGTRTYHRMACGVEDAGFEVKDTVLWCYNSGFPKAQDLGKLIDKRLGAERVERPITYRKFEDITGGKYNRQDGQTESTKVLYESDPATPEAREWDGWKVGGLKPSHEPVLWCVKPPEGPYVENVLKHGVGAINVEACRIPYESEDDQEEARYNALGMERLSKDYGEELGTLFKGGWKKHKLGDQPQGRYPANMVRTDRFGDGYDRFYFVPKADRAERDAGLEGISSSEIEHSVFDRCAKCGGLIINKGKRPSGCTCDNPQRVGNKLKNIHPTVKPVRLMEHLIKLVTRKGQIVLDPFVGSGTTCIAARNLLRRYIGFDNNPEYCEIARRRLAAIPPPLEAFA